eukprot:CAMPEP_0118956516 /NCGR_PEP_ID=MMETSP1169-20130426/61621_1 /TAXON_ID=36882 /ORGANISM="Pyramimonas obovata, Strain CCMP722" /LENGTH=226 /DNA_ID=CAMNT_0006904551 /DNA_START=652 /DNA_END=1329 /DNA_ORIENTATION=-
MHIGSHFSLLVCTVLTIPGLFCKTGASQDGVPAECENYLDSPQHATIATEEEFGRVLATLTIRCARLTGDIVFSDDYWKLEGGFLARTKLPCETPSGENNCSTVSISHSLTVYATERDSNSRPMRIDLGAISPGTVRVSVQSGGALRFHGILLEGLFALVQSLAIPTLFSAGSRGAVSILNAEVYAPCVNVTRAEGLPLGALLQPDPPAFRYANGSFATQLPRASP